METWMRYSPQKQIEKMRENIMQLTTDEIIARLMNMSVKLDGEMRFEESSTISQAIALIMTLRNAAERLRQPTDQDIVSAIRNRNQDELKAVIEWITDPK
jgi:excinuclease UvrABC nuclease subunit